MKASEIVEDSLTLSDVGQCYDETAPSGEGIFGHLTWPERYALAAKFEQIQANFERNIKKWSENEKKTAF